MTTIKTDVEFGKEYTDKNTGFTGTAICISKWGYGCIRVTLRPKVGEDGKLPESETFDEAALVSVSSKNDPGGPRPEPKRSPDPIR